MNVRPVFQQFLHELERRGWVGELKGVVEWGHAGLGL